MSKIWRHKEYNFEKNFMPIEFEWQEPEIIADEAPSDLYEEYFNEDYLISFLKEKYVLGAENGKDYVLTITAKLSLYIEMGTISIEEGEAYGAGTNNVINELNKGYWHSAYFMHIAFVPDSKLQNLHDEVSQYIKEYVNTYYPAIYKID